MKKKKILLAGGCSYTDPNFLSTAHALPADERGGWPMWPEIMGKELGLEVINTGHMGKGNTWIAKTIISNIIKYSDRIEKVVVLWTGADRIQHYNWTVHPTLDAYANEPLATEHHKYCGLNELKWSPYLFRENRVIENWFRDSLLAMYSVASICKSKGIDFIFGQGVVFFSHAMNDVTRQMVEKLHKDNPKEAYNNILLNITQHSEWGWMELIENGSFDGIVEYPIYKELKKEYKQNFIYLPKYEIYEFQSAFDFEFHQDQRRYRINSNKKFHPKTRRQVLLESYDTAKHDNHPNAVGQRYIAEQFIYNNTRNKK